jgi:hypothetical protein
MIRTMKTQITLNEYGERYGCFKKGIGNDSLCGVTSDPVASRRAFAMTDSARDQRESDKGASGLIIGA